MPKNRGQQYNRDQPNVRPCSAYRNYQKINEEKELFLYPQASDSILNVKIHDSKVIKAFNKYGIHDLGRVALCLRVLVLISQWIHLISQVLAKLEG